MLLVAMRLAWLAPLQPEATSPPLPQQVTALSRPTLMIVTGRASRCYHLIHHPGAGMAFRTRIIVLRLVLNSRARADTVTPSLSLRSSYAGRRWLRL